MATSANDIALRESVSKFSVIHASVIQNVLVPMLDNLILDIFEDAFANWGGEYLGFTGNTITSISAAVYVDGKWQFTRQMGKTRGMKDPVHRKVSAPKTIRLGAGSYSNYCKFAQRSEVYDGPPRFMTATVKAKENEYGFEMAERFLQEMQPKAKKGVSVIVCTGTEYSEYLESVRHFNVLTATYKNTARLMQANLSNYAKGALNKL